MSDKLCIIIDDKPFFTPKNVKLGVFVFFKILQKNVNYKAIGISMDWQNGPL